MAAHASDTPPTDAVITGQLASVVLASPSSPDNGRLVPIGPIHCVGAGSKRPAANRHRRRRVLESRENIRSAAVGMVWLLWVLLALLMAAFLAFAPSLVQAA